MYVSFSGTDVDQAPLERNLPFTPPPLYVSAVLLFKYSWQTFCQVIAVKAQVLLITRLKVALERPRS